MKHLLIAVLFLTGLYLAACHKHDTHPKQYSTWIVNGQDTFHTNNVDTSIDCNPDHSYCGADLRSHNLHNWFDIKFYLDYFPTNGSWPIGDSTIANTQNSDYSYIGFYYNDIFYIISSCEESYLEASIVNNKIVYKLHSAWFINYYNPSDSIQIQGTFNIP